LKNDLQLTSKSILLKSSRCKLRREAKAPISAAHIVPNRRQAFNIEVGKKCRAIFEIS